MAFASRGTPRREGAPGKRVASWVSLGLLFGLALPLPSCGTTFDILWSASIKVSAFLRAHPMATVSVSGSWVDFASTGLESSTFAAGLTSTFAFTAAAPASGNWQEVLVGEARGLKPGTWTIKTVITPSTDPRGAITCTNGVFLGFEGVENGVQLPTEVLVVEDSAMCVGPTGVFFGGGPRIDLGVGQIAVNPAPLPYVLEHFPATVLVQAANMGSRSETLRVDLAGPGTIQAVTAPGDMDPMPPGTTATRQFTWTPSGLGSSMATLLATVAPLTDEWDTSNNASSTIVMVLPNADMDTIPDASDNCRTVTNQAQEDCDGDGIGDACDDPEIRAFAPSCGLAAGERVSVVGFGFAGIQPSQIRIGGQPVAVVNSQTACSLVFANPVANPTGLVTIATNPAVQAPLCAPCPTPAIRAFDPVAGPAGTLVTAFGCGFGTGTLDVFLEPALGGMRVGPIAPQSQSPELVRFLVPTQVQPGTSYYVAFAIPPTGLIRSAGPFRVPIP